MLKVSDVASRLNVSESIVYGLVQSGRLRCHRIGNGRGVIRVSNDDLANYIESCRQGVPERARPTHPRLKLRHIRI